MKRIRAPLIAAIAVGLIAGSSGGVAAQDDPVATGDVIAPSFFTGTFGIGWRDLGGSTTETSPEGVESDFGGAFSARWATNDPRMSGMATVVVNELYYSEGATRDSPSGEVGTIRSFLTRVENDGGTWVGTLDNIQLDDPAWEISAGWLVGEGGYEGLMAYVATEYENGRKVGGYITADGPPPVPETFPEQ
jgi:hypothetical protein